MKRIFVYVLNYLILFNLATFFAIAMPLAGFAEQMVRGLTSERTYMEIIRSAGFVESARSVLDGATRSILDYVPGLKSTSLSGGLDEINRELTKAVDDAIVKVAAQVPAYVAGERDSLEADIDLSSVRAAAVTAAKRGIPGANLLGGYVDKAVEAKIPERISLENHLSTLELFLNPLRVVVTRFLSKFRMLKSAAYVCLALMVVVAFRLARAGFAVGAAALLGGTAGHFSSYLALKVFGLILPVEVLGNRVFTALISSSVNEFQESSGYWILFGAILLALSLFGPLATSAAIKKLGPGKSALFSFAFPAGERASLATVLAAAPTLLSFAIGRSPSKPRLAARSVLGGRMAAATILDYLLLPMLISGLGAVLTRFFGVGLAGGLLTLPLWLLLALFWLFRDRPRTMGGFNFIDRLSGIRRARKPSRAIHLASARRSAMLLTALLASVFVPAYLAFPSVMLMELIALAIMWPDRTLADLAAGTRARLYLGRGSG